MTAVPESFDGYRLLGVLGAGAMGCVYRARDTFLERDVAIKLIAGAAPDARDRERFLTEARAIARLSHPNVVAIHRVGEIDAQPYLVSELVLGTSLDKLPRPVAPNVVLDLAIGMAEGLAAAHRRGVLHRDIKPANLLVSEDGVVKLCDFGLAKLSPRPGEPPRSRRNGPRPPGHHGAAPDGAAPDAAAPVPAAPADLEATRSFRDGPSPDREPGPKHAPEDASPSDPFLGTPRYMAPELWRGAPASVASDLYAVGVVLHELVTGRPLFEAPSLEVLQHVILEGAVPSLAEVAPGVDPRLARIVARCLAREPEARYASADELALALGRLRAGDAAIPEGNPYRGLAPFQEEHRALFFGRASCAARIVERLRHDPLVLVTGDSGVGKSSLCRAGVLPLVAQGALGEERPWTVLRVTPGRRPVEALVAAFEALTRAPHEQVLAWIEREPLALVREARKAGDARRGIVVFVDPLEEIFTLASPGEAARFETLVAALASGVPGVRVLATVRADFLARVLGLVGLGPAAARGIELVTGLGPAAKREAVLGPARACGLAFEDDALVGEIVEGAAGPSALPLLQFALAELWEHRDVERGVLLRRALQDLGGVAGALARHADGVLAAMPDADRTVARRVLVRLATSAGDGTRARRTLGELVAEDDPREVRVLSALVSARLVAALREPGPRGDAPAGEAVYEVTHEALFTEWRTLASWLDADAERRPMLERVAAAAAEWERLGAPRDALWGPTQLAEVDRVGVTEVDLARREARFLAASRATDRARRWRTRGLLAAAVVLAGSTYGLFSWRAARVLGLEVARHEAAATRARAEAARQDALAEGARRQALAAFDGNDERQAEGAWEASRAHALRADEAYAEAAREGEAALFLAPERAAGRASLGEIVLARAIAAERHGRADLRPELAARLTNLDPSGALPARLSAPARVRIASRPPGATITLAREADDAGQRVPGASRALGTAPSEEHLGPGSYVVTLTLEGHVEARLPLVVARGEALDVEVPLPPRARAPEGFVYVPPGRFLYGTASEDLRAVFHTQPLREVTTGAYFMARTETTFAEYMSFLRALPRAQREARLPRRDDGGRGVALVPRADDTFELTLQTTAATYHAREGEPVTYAGRTIRARQDWRRFPVTGVTYDDARAYAAWLAASGKVPGARLCTEHEWERAARGADGRAYPRGDHLGPEDANIDRTYGRDPFAMGPDEVGSYPAAASPFGVLDMAGNAWEWVRSSQAAGEIVYRGGGWYESEISSRADNRQLGEATMRDLDVSFRVCADVPE